MNTGMQPGGRARGRGKQEHCRCWRASCMSCAGAGEGLQALKPLKPLQFWHTPHWPLQFWHTPHALMKPCWLTPSAHDKLQQSCIPGQAALTCEDGLAEPPAGLGVGGDDGAEHAARHALHQLRMRHVPRADVARAAGLEMGKMKQGGAGLGGWVSHHAGRRTNRTKCPQVSSTSSIMAQSARTGAVDGHTIQAILSHSKQSPAQPHVDVRLRRRVERAHQRPAQHLARRKVGANCRVGAAAAAAEEEEGFALGGGDDWRLQV